MATSSKALALASAFACVCGCAEPGEPTGLPISPEERAALMALRYDHAPPPIDPSNALDGDPAAQAFGQRLFFDPSLSGPLSSRDNDGTASVLGVVGEPGRVSCAGCHVADDHFIDSRSPHGQISLAAAWTRRRTPTLLEIAFAPVYNWDGRRDAIWNQAIGVMESPVEFNSGRLLVAQQIFRLHRAEYESVVGATMPALDDAARFPLLDPSRAGCDERQTVCHGKPGDGAEYDSMSADAQREVTEVTVNAAKAIASYVAQLRCGRSRFDDWLDGDVNALNESEQRGALLFVGRAGCASCHSGPRLTDGQFHNVGLRPSVVAVAFTDTDDRGAGEGVALALTDPLSSSGEFSDGDRHALPTEVNPSLEGAFRTPTLRCIDMQPSYMHTGQLRTFEQVVTFFNRGGDAGGYPGTNELMPLQLDELERADLAAFLRTLSGPGPEAALRQDPEER